MLSSKAERGKIEVSDGSAGPRSLVAIIGMSGPVEGAVSLQLPTNTAVAIVNQLLGTNQHVIDDTITDGVAELVNMIAGGAKAKLTTDDGKPIDLTMPKVVRGDRQNTDQSSKDVWLKVPFTSELGEFSLNVSLADKSKEQ